MRSFSLGLAVLALAHSSQAWTPAGHGRGLEGVRSLKSSALATALPEETSTEPSVLSATESLTQDLVAKLRFRELRKELESRGLSPVGTTGQLRARLREAVIGNEECVVLEDGTTEGDCDPDDVRFRLGLGTDLYLLCQ